LEINIYLASGGDCGYIVRIETVGGTSVSSGRRGEDGCHELAGAVHFHAASPAQNVEKGRARRTAFFGAWVETMPPKKIKVSIERPTDSYDVVVGSDLLRACGGWARKCLGKKAEKIAVVSNRKVFGLYGRTVEASLSEAGFSVRPVLVGDGERFKTLKTAENLLASLSDNRISRTDAVLALGGGVVGDAAGFAASVYLRGIPFLQAPTTLLAMIDSSVGGKTGVNSKFGKNLIGSFYQPTGVMADVATLRTLPQREMTAGLCEAVKQAAVAGRGLFDQTAAYLGRRAGGKALPDNELQNLLVAQIAFKAEITAGDEREATEKTGPRSRKILNFGHTLAHALEKVTNYRYFKHGEAVGYGVMFAAELSKNLEILPQNQVTLLNDVVRPAGELPPIGRLNPSDIVAALGFDKKNVGGSLQWVLLRGIGKPVIFPDKNIPRPLLLETIKSFLTAHSG
jgi:3-dehydroquinate synthase